MSNHQKQRPSGYRVRQEVVDEDMTFDASMFQTEKPKMPDAEGQKENDAEQQDRQEIDERISVLYPSHYEMQIPLEQLFPAPDVWNFFPKPDHETMRRLMQSILDYGLLHPAIVWQQEDGRYMILGGHTRYRALKMLLQLFPENADSLGTMRCNVYDHDKLDENEARQIIIMDNTTQRQKEVKAVMITAVIQMGQLMKQQRARRSTKWHEQRKRINDIIGESLGVSGGTIKGIMRFRTLIPEFLPFLDKRTANGAFIKQGQAQALAKLPEALQQEIYIEDLFRDERFAKVAPKALSSIQTVEELQQLLEAVKKDAEVETLKTIQIPVSADEYDAMRELLWSTIQQSDCFSEQTKQRIQAALG